ncbi:MAG: ATP-binding protein [Chitinophagaceae bacterium]
MNSPEFDYLENLICYRLSMDLPQAGRRHEYGHPGELPPVKTWRLPFEKFLDKMKDTVVTDDELTLLLIAIVPHVQPDLFDRVIDRMLPEDRQFYTDFPRIGGVRGKNCRFFLPTGETALYLLAGDDQDKRLQAQQYFAAGHSFWEKKIMWLEDMQNGEPTMHGRMIISPDYIELLVYGQYKSPQFSISFPAKKIAPDKKEPGKKERSKNQAASFDQLVIPKDLREQIEDLRSWVKHHKELKAKFPSLRQGYRTLFYGPPGTGKTFTARILGNELDKEVYKIDLSMVVSKYIGETEKNLELLFARAEDKNWILFFDEADALFGKRTNVRDAHDKYANQEVSYLLQRIEDYNGLVILATNMKNNIDDAFMRRFNSVLQFPFPDAPSRARIWEIFLPKGKDIFYRDKPGLSSYPDKYLKDCHITSTAKEPDIPEEVKKYELSGGSIMNVVHYAGIKAVERYHEAVNTLRPALTYDGQEEDGYHKTPDPCEEQTQFIIYLSDVRDGIRREMFKEQKPFVS